MTAANWPDVKRIFQAAFELDFDARSTLLDIECAANPVLRQEVESLLQAHDEASTFIERPLLMPQRDVNETHTLGNARPKNPIPRELLNSIPDYDMLEICGEGSFGQVWIVRDRLGVLRAMKVVDMGRISKLGVPNREVRALQHYCRNVPVHPNLVHIYHVGQSEHYFYYTMELADDAVSRMPVKDDLGNKYKSMNLSRVLRIGRLSTDTAVEITLRLLKGLECLHDAGLVHRDIKPANIIFVNKEVKLTDFSLVDLSRSQMSQVGTPQYMPPDECMDETADTYALGKVLHQMITGGDKTTFPRLPKGTASSQLDVAKLDAFLQKACAHNASERFRSGRDMREALFRCRFPLIDSPLLELADQERMGLEDTFELAALQKAVSKLDGPSSMRTVQSASRNGGDVSVLQVLDRFVKIVPWIVVLILGILLLGRM